MRQMTVQNAQNIDISHIQLFANRKNVPLFFLSNMYSHLFQFIISVPITRITILYNMLLYPQYTEGGLE